MSLAFDFHKIWGWGRLAFIFIDDVDDGIQPWVFNCCLLTKLKTNWIASLPSAWWQAVVCHQLLSTSSPSQFNICCLLNISTLFIFMWFHPFFDPWSFVCDWDPSTPPSLLLKTLCRWYTLTDKEVVSKISFFCYLFRSSVCLSVCQPGNHITMRNMAMALIMITIISSGGTFMLMFMMVLYQTPHRKLKKSVRGTHMAGCLSSCRSQAGTYNWMLCFLLLIELN